MDTERADRRLRPTDALRPRPAITVVRTDGYTPWPDRAPKGCASVIGPGLVWLRSGSRLV